MFCTVVTEACPSLEENVLSLCLVVRICLEANVSLYYLADCYVCVWLTKLSFAYKTGNAPAFTNTCHQLTLKG